MKVYELIDILSLCDKYAEIQVFYTIDNPLSEPSTIDNILQIDDIGNKKKAVIIQIQ